MPLTNAQLQARYRAKRAAKLERYETALRAIASCKSHHADDVVAVARAALNSVESDK